MDCDPSRRNETLALKTRAAEAYWYEGQYETSSQLLGEVFENARESADKTPAAIVLSRMHAQRGDSSTAFNTLKSSLSELGVSVPETTWDDCDEEYQRIIPLLQANPPDFDNGNTNTIDRRLTTLGVLLTEFQSSAYCKY